MKDERRDDEKRIDLSGEESYWREQHRRQPYSATGRDFEAWAPAYRLGYEARLRYGARAFDELDSDLMQDYLRLQDNKDLTWDEARPATRAAWERVDQRIQGLTGN